MSGCKKRRKLTDNLSILKSRFPAVAEDIIISVLDSHNNALDKATTSLSEISGVPHDIVIQRMHRRRNGHKMDKRGVHWEKMTLPEKVPVVSTTDMLSDEDFSKWLQEQDLLEKEKKEEQENLSEENDQPNQGDSSIESENSKETAAPGAVTEINTVEETNEQKIDATGESVAPLTTDVTSEIVETDGNRELVPDLIKSNLNSLDCSSCSLCIPADSVTSSTFGEKLADTVYIHEGEDQLIVLKLVFKNGSMYRFRVPRNSYSLDKLKRAVNNKLDKGYEDPITALKIKYFDDEGDWITIASQEEWEEAVRLHNDVLKVHICN